MGSILKNQILKHLSKFTKNLSPDKINISTLKGEGELSNLELEENILMDLLDLPTWMKLNKAVCNKVSIKVQWTKLKSQPICLYLDEVVLEVETCAEPRKPSSPTQQSSYRSEGRYGFIDKVIDAIYVHINSVSVQFMSDKFHASLQLSRVKVQSLTPYWAQPTDIRQTRIRSEQTDEIILFKEVDWQTTRIEANAREDENSLPSTPLRLIANQSKIRIVLKKKISDCSMIASRIIFLLDDLLWVLTDTQLKAAILYANSLSTMIEKSTEQSKLLAAEKLQKQGSHHAAASGADQLLLQQQQNQLRPRSQTDEARMFQKFDVLTTSYHLITSRIDLHLCDDTPTDKESSPKHNRNINGGSMQIVFCKLSVDYYPFHYAGGERKNWYRYSDNQGSRNSWVQGLFNEFRAEAKKARQTCNLISPSESPAHTAKSPAKNLPPQQTQSLHSTSRGQGQKQSKPKVTKLLESCMVLKIEELIIYMVSTADNKRGMPQKFFSSDKKALHLPADMSMVHLEYTDYFFTEGIDYPVPHANVYVLVNPVRLHIDYLTVLWANYFSLNLAQMVESQQGELEKKLEHVDVKLEALMPRIVISAEEKVENQPDRPNSLQIQISKLTASNTHTENRFTISDVKGLLEQYNNCDMFETNEFPNDTNKMASIPKLFHDFANKRLNPYLCGYAYDLVNGRLPDGFCDTDFGNDAIKLLLRTNTLKRDMRCDMWSICIDQVWLEFLGVPTSRTRPVPFVESFPLTLWVCQSSKIPDGVVLPSNSSTTSGLCDILENSKNPNRDAADGWEKENRKSKKLLKQYYSQGSSEGSSPTESSSDNGLTSSLSSSNCDNPTGNVQYSSLQIADFNIVAKIGAKIRAQLSNPQYLFLMRLIESISNFQVQLNADVDEYLKGDNKSPSMTFSVPLVLPDLEFAMVCPYIAELLPLSNPVDLLNSPTPESSEGKEGYGGDTDYEVQGYTEGNNGYVLDQADSQILIVTTTEAGTTQIAMSDSTSMYGEGHSIPHSQSDSTIVCHTQCSDPLHHNHTSYLDSRKDSHSTEDITQNPEVSNLEVMGQNVQYTASDSGLSSLGSSHAGHQRSRSGSKLTPTSMKKSFTSGVTNISNFMGKIKNKLDPDDNDDNFDSLSMKTDISDDDDFEFLALDDSEAPAFNHSHHSETASSTDTDDMSSVFAESTSASRAKEYVSAIVFRLSGSEVLIQGIGEDIFFCLHTQAVDCEETGNIVYEDFYNKLSSQNGVIRTPANLTKKRHPVKFKMTLGPSAEQLAPKGGELGLMDVRVKDYEFTFRMSSVLNMSSFIEDEKIAIPTPMHVTVEKFRLTLVEDRPPPRPIEPQCTPPPLHLNIHEMFIYRHDDGVFHMTKEMPPLEVLKLTSLDLSKSPLTNGMAVANLTKASQDSLDLTNIPVEMQDKIRKMQNENAQLKILLEKLDDHTQEQEDELDKLRKMQKQLDDVNSENKELRNKLKSFALSSGPSLDDMEDLRKVNSDLEKDNSALCERVVNLEEDIHNMTLEKDSLVTTLQLMQDELMASEQVRQRNNTQ